MEYVKGQPVGAIAQFDFRGGVNEYVKPYLLAPNQIALGEDCETRFGPLQERLGYDLKNTSGPSSASGQQGGLWRCYDGSDGNQLVALMSDGKMYRLNGAALTSIMSSPATITGPATAAQWQRKLWVTTSTNGLHKWDNDDTDTLSAAAAGPATNCKYIWLYKQFNALFAGGSGTAGKESIVYHSDLGLPETWPTNNFFHIPQDMSGDTVQGFAELPGGELCIMGARTVNIYYGRVRADAILRTVDWVHGSRVGQYGIVSTPVGVFYPSFDGFYLYDGSAGGAQKVSYAVETTFKNMDFTNFTAALVTDGRVFMSYRKNSSSTFNDRVLVYNLPRDRGSLGTWDGPWIYDKGVNAFSWWNGDGDTGEIYATTATSTTPSATAGQVFQLEQGNDDGGAAYGMVVEGPEHYISMDPKVLLQDGLVAAEVSDGADVKVFVKADGREKEQTSRTVTLSEQGPRDGDKASDLVSRSQVHHPLVMNALKKKALRTIQFRFEASVDKKGKTIRGYRVDATMRGPENA